MRRVGVPLPSTVTPVASSASPKRDSHGCGSSSDDDDHYSSRRVPTPWVSSSSQPPPDVRVPTTLPVSLPPGFQSPLASDAHSSLTGYRPVDCPLRLRVDEALLSNREDERNWSDAWRTQQSCSARRHATLMSHLFDDRELPSSWISRSVGFLEILSCNPGLARGSDPSILSSHLNEWPVACDLLTKRGLAS